MSASRRKGTAWESAIVDAIVADGHWPHVERRALAGANDKGDIAGIPLVVIEAKAAKTWRVGEWLAEVAAETVNADADRLPRLAQMIATVAETHQVLVFSCQDRMVELLQQADPLARVITLPGHAAGTGTARMGAVS